MQLKVWLPSTIGALLIGIAAGPSNAASTNGVIGAKRIAPETSEIEQVQHRCYRHRGQWHCPRHGRYYRNYDRPNFRFYFRDGRRHYHRRDW
jgi:hypothetical protein